jgi:protein tyrosine/serine phosphatase
LIFKYKGKVMFRTFRISFWAPALLLLVFGSYLGVEAQSPAVEKKDLPKFNRVDDHYLRGAQPTEAGFRQLAQMGVHLVIDLRDDRGDRNEWEEKLVTDLGMRYVNLPISTWRAPDEDQIQRFMGLVRENQNQPVFVHCWRGNDRTGLATGLYRVEFYNWTPEEAYKEMKQSGFSLSFLRKGMKSYLFDYAKRKAENNGNGASASAGQSSQ